MNAVIDATKGTLFERGAHFGSYTIRHQLQQGGMASVYVAYDEATCETVVLKIMRVEASAAEGCERLAQFRHERDIMRTLSHPHILPLLAAGRRGAHAYLVMPYIQGGTLKDRLECGAISSQETQHIFSQLASALDYMHDCGILHRDIKPANILLDRDGEVYLADFGIASHIGVSAIEDNGLVMGTPIYMAPELCYGHASVGSDIYALGILLYQMLTGQAPFEGADSWSVCLRQIEEKPVRPALLNPAIQQAVEQVIICALEKDATLRFSSIAEFAFAYEKSCRPSLFTKVQGFLNAFVSSVTHNVQDIVYSQTSEQEYTYDTESIVINC